MVRIRRLGALLAVLAWVALLLGDGAGVVHELTVRHVRCTVHGDLIELRPGEAAEAGREAGPGIRAAAPDAPHARGCPVPAPAPPRAFAATTTEVGALPHTPVARPRAEEPAREPPLVRAPKTSPPAA